MTIAGGSRGFGRAVVISLVQGRCRGERRTPQRGLLLGTHACLTAGFGVLVVDVALGVAAALSLLGRLAH